MRHYSIVDECILEIIHELVMMVITSENNEFIMNGRSVLYSFILQDLFGFSSAMAS